MSTTALSDEETQRIHEYLDRHPRAASISSGSATIAAINMGLSGELTDRTPDSMSSVIAGWLKVAQNALPESTRTSDAWRALITTAAGTGRRSESERAEIIASWMWGTVLSELQDTADRHGFGPAWQAMVTARTHDAARAAADAARAAASDWSRRADISSAEASDLAADAAGAAADAASAITTRGPGRAAVAATFVAEARAADACALAGAAGERAAARLRARTHAHAAAWRAFDPLHVLRLLIGGVAAFQIEEAR